MTDVEITLLRSLPTDDAMVVQVDGKAIADPRALERVIEILQRFQQSGWVELVTSPGRGRGRYKAAAARLTPQGEAALRLLGEAR